MPSESTPQFESRFPELKLPEHGWESNIPDHLLIDTDPQMEWLLKEISKNTQATNFSCQAVVDISKHLRTLNGRVAKGEQAMIEAKEGLNDLNEQAKSVSPFLKPISMFAALWEYSIFKWVFVSGLIFFVAVLYPIFLSSSFVSWMKTFLGQ